MDIVWCMVTDKRNGTWLKGRENMENREQKVTHRRGRALAVIAVVAVIVLAVTAGIVIYDTPEKRLARQLDLGNRYLEEQNYEQAIVAFDLAIAIDPKSAEAYLGKAEAYIGLEDTGQALATLERGYEVTRDEQLKARMDEMTSVEAHEQETLVEKGRINNKEREARINEIVDLLINAFVWDSTQAYTHLLTYEQVRSSYAPIAAELEGYLENETGSWEIDAWTCLAKIYLHMGEMEKCLETRRRGYKATGNDGLRPELYTDDEITKDEYGRMISEEDGIIYTYGDADYLLSWVDENEKEYRYVVYAVEFEYDSEGRIIAYSTEFLDLEDRLCIDRWEYEYQRGNTLLVKLFQYDKDGEHLSTTVMSYDEYGIVPEELRLTAQYERQY